MIDKHEQEIQLLSIFFRLEQEASVRAGHAFNEGYRSRDSDLPKSYQKGIADYKSKLVRDLGKPITMRTVKKRFTGIPYGQGYKQGYNELRHRILQILKGGGE